MAIQLHSQLIKTPCNNVEKRILKTNRWILNKLTGTKLNYSEFWILNVCMNRLEHTKFLLQVGVLQTSVNYSSTSNFHEIRQHASINFNENTWTITGL